MRCETAPAVAGMAVSERESFYLHAGQLLVSATPSAVTTILGSCVAVCLWDRRLSIGGLNHYLLPHWAGEGHSSPRFGNVAIELLLRQLQELGCQTRSLEAKLFGGACVIGSFRQNDGDHLGAKNVELARRVLAGHRIPVAAQDVLGNKGRKLIFHTDQGTAWVRDLA